jgi:gluconolactonase
MKPLHMSGWFAGDDLTRYWLFLLGVLTLLLSLLRAQTAGDHIVVRLDPSLDALVAEDAKLETLFEGGPRVSFEGPTWVHDGKSGFLIFTDVPGNVINKWTPDGKVSVFLDHIYTGNPSEAYRAPGNRVMIGANGTTLDRQGRLVYTEYSAGQIVRLEKDGKRTVLAERFDGRRINAPNDLVFKSDGSLYFTDSRASSEQPDGLHCGEWWMLCGPQAKDRVPHKGVYLVKAGKVQLLSKDIDHPNGLTFSPDEKYFYVSNSLVKNILGFDVRPDGTMSNEKVFIDMSSDKADGLPDGIKVDTEGDVYCTGPGGIWIMSPTGKHLGTILTPQHATNFTFGGDDAKTLYITGVSSLSRVPLKVAGIRP